MPEPRLSIIIPTYNRREFLLRLLDAVGALQAGPGELEVIVVDDASTDGTLEALDRRRDPFPRRLLRQSAQGPSAARNLGAAAARGEILGFLDSDVLVHPYWWRAAAPHFEDPRVAAVEGATLPPENSPRPTPFTNFVSNTRGGSYQTCNFLCRRERFRQLGGFDERYCVRLKNGRILHSREDSDLAFTLLEQGQRIVFEPGAVVWHPLPAPAYGLYFLTAHYGWQEALLRRKHPALYRRHLKWIDGRAFPVFYWGLYLGAPAFLAGALASLPILAGPGLLGAALGWAGAVYVLCRKRRAGWLDVLALGGQMVILPWLRLYWVLRGEWKFRRVRPDSAALQTTSAGVGLGGPGEPG